MSDARWSDRKIVLWMGAVILLLIIVVSVLAPNTADDDGQPTTYNNGPQGAKAAFLMLQAIGRTTSRWQRPTGDLGQVDALAYDAGAGGAGIHADRSGGDCRRGEAISRARRARAHHRPVGSTAAARRKG